MVKYSIIIPVRAINDFVKENIYHLEKMNYQNFEVLILVDFENETYDFEEDNRFKIIYVPGSKGPGEKRNVGAQNSTGEILAFLDDDAYPAEDWLVKADEIFADPDIYALGGPAVTPLDAEFLERMSGRVLESYLSSAGFTYRHIPSPRRSINDYPTVNLFVRKKAFFEVGGFLIDFWPGEDTKLCLDLVKKYQRDFIYDPKPVVYHHRRNLFRPHLKQISRYGQHRGQFARIFPETSRLPSYFVPSLFVAGLILGPAVCSVIPQLRPIYVFTVNLYIILLTLEFIKVTIKERSLDAGIHVVEGIFLTHIVYGINFVIGFIKKPKLKLKAVDQITGNYSEG